MSEPAITVPADAMKAIVVKALLDSWSPEQRDAVLAQAVASLLNDKADARSFSSNSPTVLQAAANDAMRLAAGDVIRTQLKDGPWAERLQDEVMAALKSLFETEGGAAPIRQAIAQGLSERLEFSWR